MITDIPKLYKIWFFIKCIFGFGSIKDRSICWFSDNFFDIHDYKINKGGDNIPKHFYIYRCNECGKIFTI